MKKKSLSRKLICTFLSILLLFSTFAVSASADAIRPVRGDVDCNGKIQCYDALLALEISCKIITNDGQKSGAKVSSTGFSLADIDRDGYCTVLDALIILQMSVDKKTGYETTEGPAVPLGFNSTESAQNFSVNFFKQAIQGNDNAVVSPLSVMTALALEGCGAKGKSKKQFEQLLATDFNGNTSDMQSVAEYFSNYIADIISSSTKDAKVNISNSIWLNSFFQKSIPVNPEYLATAKSAFNAEITSSDFSDPDTVNNINDWVAEKTDNMIKEILDETDPNYFSYVLNALLFDAKWEDDYYNEGETDIFYNADGTVSDASFLYSTEDKYVHNDIMSGYVKNYSGGRYSFVTMLPNNKKMSIEQCIDSMSGKSFADYITSCDTSYDVNAVCPKFISDDKMYLIPMLQKLGLTEVFSRETADLSGIAGEKGYLYIDLILHKTRIELDSNGTKAAAVTVIGNEVGSLPPEEKEEVSIILDRPFAYAIVDNYTNVPLFMGTVTGF